MKATVEGNLECFALGACCWRCPEATPYLNGSTKCLALPRCSSAAAFLGFLSKVVGFRFCLLLGVCLGATVVRWSGGFRKLVFGSRRKRACKRWVRVTLKGRIVRHSLPVKGKHSWRPMMRVLCLVRKVLEKFTAPRVRCKAEAQWTPEAERVVHRSRMLAGLPVETPCPLPPARPLPPPCPLPPAPCPLPCPAPAPAPAPAPRAARRAPRAARRALRTAHCALRTAHCALRTAHCAALRPALRCALRCAAPCAAQRSAARAALPCPALPRPAPPRPARPGPALPCPALPSLRMLLSGPKQGKGESSAGQGRAAGQRQGRATRTGQGRAGQGRARARQGRAGQGKGRAGQGRAGQGGQGRAGQGGQGREGRAAGQGRAGQGTRPEGT